MQRSDAAEGEETEQTARDGRRHRVVEVEDLAPTSRENDEPCLRTYAAEYRAAYADRARPLLTPCKFWHPFRRVGVLRFAALGSMVALDIKPPSGLCTHERMTAYIASKGVTELYADSLEALLRAEPDNPAEFLADHFASLTEHVESYADTYVPAPPCCTCGPRVRGLLRTGGAGPPAPRVYCTVCALGTVAFSRRAYAVPWRPLLTAVVTS